jgi:hypothetical protein
MASNVAERAISVRTTLIQQRRPSGVAVGMAAANSMVVGEMKPCGICELPPKPVNPRLSEMVHIILDDFQGDVAAYFDSLRKKETETTEPSNLERVAETLSKNL